VNQNQILSGDQFSDLDRIIQKIKHLLPTQGPIGTFIHHNTLHSFEDRTFEDAIEDASKIYSAKAYLNKRKYRSLFALGRIRGVDVESELSPYLKEDNKVIADKISRKEFRQKLFYLGLFPEDKKVTAWRARERILHLRSDIPEDQKFSLIKDAVFWAHSERARQVDILSTIPSLALSKSEFEALLFSSSLSPEISKEHDFKKFDEVTAHILWHLSSKAAELVTIPKIYYKHHREFLLKLTGEDIFELVNHHLIQIIAAFTDQAVSYWPLPERQNGLIAAATALFEQKNIPASSWTRKIRHLFRRIRPLEIGPKRTIEFVLDELGIKPEQYEEYLQHHILPLKGWAGFIAFLEDHPDFSINKNTANSFNDFVALQMLFLLAAIEHVSEKHHINSIHIDKITDIYSINKVGETHSIAQVLFELSQVVGISASLLASKGKEIAEDVIRELDSFPSLLRQRIWHSAYEKSFVNATSATFYNHKKRKTKNEVEKFESQLIFCIDEREESLRRHIEEINPLVETFGSPGFFSLPISFRNSFGLHSQNLCPAVMKPLIMIEERMAANKVVGFGNLIKKTIGYFTREVILSRALFRESFISATIGYFSLIPWALRVLTPGIAGKLHEIFHDPQASESIFDIKPAQHNLNDSQVREIVVNAVKNILETTGISAQYSKLIFIVGHGSSSLNNPHESAHDCGACGGNRGAPNARLFARFANDPVVRVDLQKIGICIPVDTYFAGAYHDTCDDSMTFFDEELITEGYSKLYTKIKDQLIQACTRNAAERSRKFYSEEKVTSLTKAAQAMLHRAQDFAEPRPEYGHATNALAFVGKRSYVKGLFLDRRSFLSSYNSELDPEGTILKDLLGAIVPVCLGINLEYYFSFIDPIKYGCGTKLPHNITGYNGVMDGTESDLRTGLPWQMVEIHEPVRLLMLIEASPKKVLSVLDKLPKIKDLFIKRWAWLVAIDPETNEYHKFVDGNFENFKTEEVILPVAGDSLSYCLGKHGLLPFGEIVPLHKDNIYFAMNDYEQ